MKMKWKKLGKIFDPTEHKLPFNCNEFAQSPQALVFDDFVRIYFSSRQSDNGKFLSHICFADFDKGFKKVLKVSDSKVIQLGKLGSFDEHGIFPFSPVRVNEKIFAYTCGWSRRVSVSVETSTGLAVSDDNGLSFQKIGDGPVLTSSLHEPFLVGDSFVQKIDNMFHMWYIYGLRWSRVPGEELPARVYKIGYAHSPDGISWVKLGRQLIPDKLDSDECQALPTIIYHNNEYHMVFCYRHATGFRNNKERGYKLGYASSINKTDWVRKDDDMEIDFTADWESAMQCYPNLFNCDGKIYLLYNGNEFGKRGFGLAELMV